MRHRAARRLLPQLLDRTLPFPLEEKVRRHTERCVDCSQRLAEFEVCDRLVAQLPFGVLPFAASASSQERLEGLARWAFAGRSPRRAGLEGLALAAAAAAVAGVVALAGTYQWLPRAERTSASVMQIAYVVPAPARAR